MKSFSSVEELQNQGVMFYHLEKTTLPKESMLEDWRMFNIYFIDKLISTKKNLVYIFIGFDAQQYAGLITEEEYGSKIFLPEITSKFWNSNTLKYALNTQINSLLESKKLEPIVW
jgi:uracil DNA glycosylase